MRLTGKQKRALRLIRLFIPRRLKKKLGREIHGGEKEYFEYTERGIEPEQASESFSALLQGHKWLGVHEKMWSQDAQEGLLFYEDFEEMPFVVQKFVRKRVFKGEYNG